MSERRGRQEQKKEDPVITVAKALAPQMGSDPKHLGRQEIDQRKFAVLNVPILVCTAPQFRAHHLKPFHAHLASSGLITSMS